MSLLTTLLAQTGGGSANVVGTPGRITVVVNEGVATVNIDPNYIASGAQGGTGVNNGDRTITVAGNITTVGAFPMILNVTAATDVIMPTTGSITTYEESYYQITGFVNQIQVIPISFPGNPKRGLDIKISSSYAGQDSIYQVGILTFGTWHANLIEVAYGGTGAASFTPYGVVIGGATSTAPLSSVTDLGSEGFVLQSNGPGLAPTFLPPTGIQTLEGTPDRITVTLDDTDAVVDIAATYVGQTSITTLGVVEVGEWDATTIRVAKGGTGTIVFDPNGLILGGPEAFDPLTSIANGPLGSLLMSLGPDELPVWSLEPVEATLITQTDETVTYPNSVGLSTFPTGFLRSETGTGDLASLIMLGTTDRITVINGSGPGNPTFDIASNYEGQTSIDTLGIVDTGVWQGTPIDLASYVAGDLDVSHLNGGTGADSSSFWRGDGTWRNAVQSITLAGANGIVITGTNPIGPVFTSGTITITAPTYPPDFPGAPTIIVVGIIVTGSWNADTIQVPYGGTGNTTFTPFSVITAGTTATGPFQNVVGVGTLGQVLKSSDADALPVWGDIQINGTTNQIDVAAGTIPTLSLSSNVIMPGTLTLSADPVSDMQAATKQYVDAIAAGIDLIAEVFAATTPAGGNLNATYDNGVAGVGATLTNAGTLEAFVTDDTSPALNARILIKDQINAFENGIYTLTVVGDGSTAWVLTRATDYNTPAEIVAGNLVPVESGTVNANTTWLETATVTVIGTDPISYIQFSFANTVVSVSGTADRITSTGDITPVIDIAATYVGQTSLTTLGTVSTGTWNASPIAINKITPLTASRAVASDASGFLTVSATTATELGYLNGVTSAVQAQLNDKISQNGSQIYAADAGSTDAYAITLSPALLSYTTGMAVYVKFNTANTGSASLNINSLGAKLIKKNATNDLVTGDIVSGQIGCLVYDGTNFQMQSGVASLSGLGTMAYQNADAVAITGGTLNGSGIELFGNIIEDATIISGTITNAAITGGTMAAITEFDCDNWTINDNFIQGIYTDTELQILLSSTDGATNVATLETTTAGTEGRLHLTNVSGTNNLIATPSGLLANTINKVSITEPFTGATLTLANNSTLVTSGAFSTTLTSTATTNVTLPTSGTLLSTAATITVAQGGTGQTSYTNGQLLIGNTTGNTLTKATLTGTANQINVTNGAGSITLGLSATLSVPTLTVKNGSAANTIMNIVAGDYTVFSYTSTLFFQAGIGDAGFPYRNWIRCVNTGNNGSGASQSNLTFGYSTYAPNVDTEVLRINNSGNVLIGTTTNTGSKLVVNGNVEATTFNGFTIGATSTIGKNLLLNGDFQVSQSGTSFAVAASSTQYTSDMWQIKTNANQAYTVTNLTGINGMVIRRNSGQTGTGQILYGQSLTIDQCYGAAGNKVTFTFTCNKGTNYSAAGNVLALFIIWGTGSSDSSGINGTWSGGSDGFGVFLTTTPTTYSFTTTAALASNVTQLGVFFGMTPTGTAGADDSFTVKNVKLEYGSSYTGYDHLSYAETLQSVLPFHYRMTQASDCYYAMLFGYVTAGNTVKRGRGGILFPVPMRTTPTVLFDTASNFTVNMAAAGDSVNDSTVSSISSVAVNNKSITIDAIMNPSTALVRQGAGILKTTSGQTSFIDFNCYLT